MLFNLSKSLALLATHGFEQFPVPDAFGVINGRCVLILYVCVVDTELA